LAGKPDIVYVSKKIVIFLDGDFWHGYNWKKLGKVPPRKYWQKKIQKNIDRAKKYNKMLKKDGSDAGHQKARTLVTTYTNDTGRAAMLKWWELGDQFWGMFSGGF